MSAIGANTRPDFGADFAAAGEAMAADLEASSLEDGGDLDQQPETPDAVVVNPDQAESSELDAEVHAEDEQAEPPAESETDAEGEAEAEQPANVHQQLDDLIEELPEEHRIIGEGVKDYLSRREAEMQAHLTRRSQGIGQVSNLIEQYPEVLSSYFQDEQGNIRGPKDPGAQAAELLTQFMEATLDPTAPQALAFYDEHKAWLESAGVLSGDPMADQRAERRAPASEEDEDQFTDPEVETIKAQMQEMQKSFEDTIRQMREEQQTTAQQAEQARQVEEAGVKFEKELNKLRTDKRYAGFDDEDIEDILNRWEQSDGDDLSLLPFFESHRRRVARYASNGAAAKIDDAKRTARRPAAAPQTRQAPADPAQGKPDFHADFDRAMQQTLSDLEGVM